jgi:PAS domain S-box-containing protein
MDKGKKPDELITVKKELVFQNQEKEKLTTALSDSLEQVSFLATTADNTHDSIIAFDTNYIITRWNDAAEKLLEWKSEEAIGKTSPEILHPIFLNDTREQIHELMKGEGVWHGEVIFHSKTGRKVNVLVISSNLKDPQNNVIGAIIVARDISERKKAEEEVLKVFKEKETVLNRISDGVVSVDNQWRYTFLNDAAMATHPQSKEMLLGRVIWEVHPEIRGTVFWDTYHEAMQTGIVTEIESYYAPMDIWFSVKAYPSADGLTIFYNDVTERKKAEETIKNAQQKLLKSNTLFTEFFAKIPASVMINRLDNGEIINVNETFLSLFKFSTKQEVIGKTGDELNILVHPEQRDELTVMIENGQIVRDFEFECRNTLNEKFWISTSIVFIEVDDIPCMSCISIDISERKKIENNLLQSEARLKEAQALSHVCNWEFDLVTNIKTWSDELNTIFGLNREEIKPTFEDFLSLVHYDDYEFAKASIEKSFQTFEEGSVTVRIKIKNGTIYLFTEWQFEFDKNNKAIRLYGIFQDVTERKIAEEEREKLTKALIQRNRDLEQFTFIISHNLRAPIANIIGYSDFLLNEILAPKEQKEFLQGLSTSVLQMDVTIKDINAILQAKLDLNEKKEFLSFSKLLNGISSNVGPHFDKYKVHIQPDFSDVDEIYSLKVYMQSIFHNLIDNSIKYSKPNQDIFIEIKSRKEKGKIILTFKDNGLGIDMKTKGDKVFGLYKRFHSHIEGKGMGLFMVKTQVEAIGGKITVTSELNKGTEFTIVFEI